MNAPAGIFLCLRILFGPVALDCDGPRAAAGRALGLGTGIKRPSWGIVRINGARVCQENGKGRPRDYRARGRRDHGATRLGLPQKTTRFAKGEWREPNQGLKPKVRAPKSILLRQKHYGGQEVKERMAAAGGTTTLRRAGVRFAGLGIPGPTPS